MSVNSLLNVSNDVLTRTVFSFCDLDDIINLSGASKALKKVSELDHVWKQQSEYYFQTTSKKYSKRKFQQILDGEFFNGECETITHSRPFDLSNPYPYAKHYDSTNEGPFVVKMSTSSVEIMNYIAQKTEVYVFNNVIGCICSIFRTKNIITFLFKKTQQCFIYSRKDFQLINEIDLSDFDIESINRYPNIRLINDSLIAIFNTYGLRIHNFNTGEIFYEEEIERNSHVIDINIFKDKIFIIYNSCRQKNPKTIDIKTKKVEEVENSEDLKFHFFKNKILKFTVPLPKWMHFFHATKDFPRKKQEGSKLRSSFDVTLIDKWFFPSKIAFQGNICLMYRYDYDQKTSTLVALNLNSKKIVFVKKLEQGTNISDIKIFKNKIYLHHEFDGFVSILKFKTKINETTKTGKENKTSKMNFIKTKFQILVNRILNLAIFLFTKIKELFQKIRNSISKLNKWIFSFIKIKRN